MFKLLISISVFPYIEINDIIKINQSTLNWKHMGQVAKYKGETFCERLNILLEKSNVTLNQLSKNSGIPIATLHRLRTDPKANPTITSLKPIADYFNITINQLIGDEPISCNEEKEIFVKNMKIPIISWSQATIWIAERNSIKNLPLVSTDIKVSRNSFALEIIEDMNDGFRKGSIIIVDPKLEPEDIDYVIAFKNQSNDATLKQLRIYDGEKYLKPLNNEFSTVLLTDEYTIVGVVRQIKFDFIGKKNK